MSRFSHLESQGEKLASKIRRVAECLEKQHGNVKFARHAGSASALIRGVITVVASVAAVPTGGLTLPAAGMTLSSAGGLVSTGACIAEMIIETCNLAALQKEWEQFVKTVLTEYRAIYSKSMKFRANIKGDVSLFCNGLKVVKTSFPGLKEVGLKEAAKRLSTGASQIGQAAKDGGLKRLSELGAQAIGKELVFFRNVVLIPINFIDLVRTAVDLKQEKKSEACKVLLKLATCADKSVGHLIESHEMFLSLPETYQNISINVRYLHSFICSFACLKK